MPAKRSSRKPRTASPRPSTPATPALDVTPKTAPDLPTAPDLSALPAASVPVPPVVPEAARTPLPPKAGPPVGGARLTGRGNPRAAQSRRYAFRRS
ncbi:hypothetical protein [Micromonospora okii]|uniref:hypothetical protein n=1 Tax=Micromonospora okii TaxID=1182970 RepID=UPI001E3A8FB0|nr:hypothetical protein [Micromonospora okii]